MTWYRSLYWRIALGAVAFLAAMLVVQAMLFVFAVSRSGRSLPGQSPAHLGQTVALDLTNELARDPQVDLERYIHEQYAQYTHPFFVMMADGRVITSGSRSFPEPLLGMARAQLQRRIERPDRRRTDRPDGLRPPWLGGPGAPEAPGASVGARPGRPDVGERSGFLEDVFGRGGDLFEADPNGFRFVRPSPVLIDGRLVAIVVVPPQAPFGFLLGRFAPMLAFVATAVLIVGAVLTSVMIFGPARRRLRSLESAARRLGSGDLSARAPDRGGDEIAAVASAFNAMADDLAARANALSESDRVRRQLLADVSHELTTPITAMRGYLETLTMPEIALDEQTRARYLGIVGDETRRLERLIDDLLDLARLEGGGGALHIETIPVADLFARVEARHGRACETAGIAIVTAIGPGAETLAGDRDRLEQAIQNLAANALRYAPRGSAIRLTSSVSDHGVALSVEDQGSGIAPEHLVHVFDRFYKADQARTGAAGGSGLGLSIVKTIVERHGGRISVVSRPGATVFEMLLPGPAPEQGPATAH